MDDNGLKAMKYIQRAGASIQRNVSPPFLYSISTLSKFYFFSNFMMKINSIFNINNNTD